LVREELYDDESFQSRNLAALIASKVLYHLEELDDALKYALGAGDLFRLDERSEYVETMISKCVDEYIRVRVLLSEGKHEEVEEDPRLVVVVEKMFDRCFSDGQFKQALGIALESHRLDRAKSAILSAQDVPEILHYCLSISQKVIQSREFRHQVLKLLVELYRNQKNPDYIAICQCLFLLDDAATIAHTLETLLKGSVDDALTAYQVAFDLSDNENQPFLFRVSEAITGPKSESAEGHSGSDTFGARLTHIKNILSGEMAISLHLQFMHSNCHTDVMIIKNIKEKIESRISVTHNAAIVAHSLMFCGTTRDKFIRDNLEWLTRANNWAKFSATACFGVIHKGHHKKSKQLFQPYLPQNGSRQSPYLEGGALYGIGLIHANRGGDQTDFFLDSLRNSGNNEIVQHGACLGLGLNAMATYRRDVYDYLKESILFTDNAVSGESAGIAIGLVFLGSGESSVIQELITYAHETQHEKIIRGISVGIGLIMLGREEQSDVLVENLLADKDPIMRYSGCFTLGLAYVGSGNNNAIRKLLHVAVSDVSYDVRRMAVIALGFVLSNTPEKVPQVVALLAESYNSYQRYGAALAVGIACAGTGSKAAIKLLQTLAKDRIDFVRQGALIALSMVLIQRNSKQEPYVTEFRNHLTSTIEAKAPDTMTKFGAILASGILDAGGRNCSISLISPNGNKRIGAIVGAAVFCNYWYWYPLLHFISLSITPTAVIGLNKDLVMPQNFVLRSKAPPSLFAYPPALTVKKEEKAKQTFTAELSISAKAKARAAKRKKDKEGAEGVADAEMKVDTSAKPEEKEPAAENGEASPKAEQKPEPEFEDLHNPARVTPSQRSVITTLSGQRYVPVTNVSNYVSIHF
jgi:26S proteasome regulatory subunit N2